MVPLGEDSRHLLQWFTNWWSALPPWLRRGIALALLAFATLWYLLTGGLRLSILSWALGGCLLLFGGPSQSEKRGYRF